MENSFGWEKIQSTVLTNCISKEDLKKISEATSDACRVNGCISLSIWRFVRSKCHVTARYFSGGGGYLVYGRHLDIQVRSTSTTPLLLLSTSKIYLK